MIENFFATPNSILGGPYSSRSKSILFDHAQRFFRDANNSSARGYLIASRNISIASDNFVIEFGFLRPANSPEKAPRLFPTTKRTPSVSRNILYTRALCIPSVVLNFVTSHSERNYDDVIEKKKFFWQRGAKKCATRIAFLAARGHEFAGSRNVITTRACVEQ